MVNILAVGSRYILSVEMRRKSSLCWLAVSNEMIWEQLAMFDCVENYVSRGWSDICVVDVITGMSCVQSLSQSVWPVRSDQTLHPGLASQDLNITGPWSAGGLPPPPWSAGVQLRSQELASGIKITVQSTITRVEGEGGGWKRYKLLYSSFKWGLKTGHFYSFIRTFRTSWSPRPEPKRYLIIHFIRKENSVLLAPSLR